MKKKVLRFIIILMVVLTFSGLLYIVYRNLYSDTDKKKNFFTYPKSSSKEITNCKTDDCQIPIKDTYLQIKLNDNYGDLNKKIITINNKTSSYYELVENSDVDDDICENVKDLYYHRYRVNTHFYTYESDKYITIGAQWVKFDLCLTTYENNDALVYIYDKESKKLISTQEFKNKESITESEIKSAIDNALDILEEENTNITLELKENYDDAMFLMEDDGSIDIMFSVPELNIIYYATLRS